MKNEIEIHNLKNKIKENKLYLSLKIKALEKQEEELQNICNHSIVFKATDPKPHKIVKIDLFYCPACGKKIKQFNNEINDMAFANSKIIELGFTDLLCDQEVLENIQNETMLNSDFYYDENVLPNIKAATIKQAIKGKVLKKDM